VPVSDDDLATLMYTGGTTGRAKGVMLSHRNLYYCSRSSHEASQAEGITRALTPLPLSHAYGMIVTLVGFHATERTLGVLQRWFDPAQFLALAQQHRIQRTALVPAMVQMLLAQPLEDFDLSSLRYVNCGAAPLAAETRQQWERRVPSSEILEGYGCTESGAVISVNPPGASRPGSVGLPIPGYQVAIRDDSDADLPAGTDGEICTRADGVMAGYWNAPEETATALRGGWLHTGDIGHLDEAGYLTITDRLKDMYVCGGFNVYPAEVEQALARLDGVAESAVIGVPDDRLGEVGKAFVVTRPGYALDTLQVLVYCRQRLANYKVPRYVEFCSALPRNAAGKTLKRLLRKEAR
jgi:long-chain acyl-CoA synthetase